MLRNVSLVLLLLLIFSDSVSARLNLNILPYTRTIWYISIKEILSFIHLILTTFYCINVFPNTIVTFRRVNSRWIHGMWFSRSLQTVNLNWKLLLRYAHRRSVIRCLLFIPTPQVFAYALYIMNLLLLLFFYVFWQYQLWYLVQGLYQSSGNFCTQCEAESFWKITLYHVLYICR